MLWIIAGAAINSLSSIIYLNIVTNFCRATNPTGMEEILGEEKNQ